MRIGTILLPALLSVLPAGSARAGTLGFTPSSHDFGLVSVSAGAMTTSITVTNIGSATTITGLVTSGACTEFAVTPEVAFPVVLASNQALVLQAGYDPADRTADLCTCTTVDDNGVTDSFELRGDGAAPQLVSWTPSLQFADQPWNSAVHETLAVMIGNVGEEPFAEANLGLALTTGTQFALGTPTGPFPVEPGGFTAIPVRFDPTGTGLKLDLLTISLDNDTPGAPNPTVTLTGTGTEAVSVGAGPGPRDGFLSLGPSPTRGTLRALVSVRRAGVLDLEVTDVAGRVVARTRSVEAHAGLRAAEFHAGRDWSPRPGLYLVRARLDGEVIGVRRVTVLH